MAAAAALSHCCRASVRPTRHCPTARHPVGSMRCQAGSSLLLHGHSHSCSFLLARRSSAARSLLWTLSPRVASPPAAPAETRRRPDRRASIESMAAWKRRLLSACNAGGLHECRAALRIWREENDEKITRKQTRRSSLDFSNRRDSLSALRVWFEDSEVRKPLNAANKARNWLGSGAAHSSLGALWWRAG